MQMRTQLSIALVAFAATSCASVPDLPVAPQVPAPLRGENFPPYYIQPGDVIAVRLMLNPELNEETTVRPDGHISTTVVADAVAAGHTVSELTEILRRGYANDVQRPRITVV